VRDNCENPVSASKKTGVFGVRRFGLRSGRTPFMGEGKRGALVRVDLNYQ